MRRAFKSYLRHPLSKKPTVTGPSEPEIIEVTILPEWDAVLRYDGSPLMAPGTVNDPGGDVAVVPGGFGNYNKQDSDGIDENGNVIDWIAIGLGTDNQPIDKFRSPNPIDDTVDLDDDITDGVVYTNTGPTRSVLSFNLEDIPAGAEIVSAELELVPVTDGTFSTKPGESPHDVWNEFDGENTNVWPDTGVNCEIQNLIRDTEETCTWNASSHATRSVNGVQYPEQTKRWHNQPNSETLPNPIGAMQNSKRWDVQEGAQLFSNQYNDSGTIDEIDSNRSEKYGHVGYGAMGGGAVENVPELKNQLPRFTITKGAHTEQMDGDTEVGGQDMPLIDVSRSVRYAHQNQAGRCNLLLRATHWEGVLDPTEDQTEETFIPPVLRLDSITLQDETDFDDEVEIDHNAIIEFDPAFFDVDGNPNTDGEIDWLQKAEADNWQVSYDWQVKYPSISNFTCGVFVNEEKVADETDQEGGNGNEPISFKEGDILTVKNISSDGGFNNQHYFEFFLDDGSEDENDGGEQPQGIVIFGVGDQDFVIGAGNIPDDDTSIAVGVRIGARAQGANPSLEDGPAFPMAMQEIQLGSIEKPSVEVTDPEFSFTYVITKQGEIVDEEAVFGDGAAPLNNTDVYTIKYQLDITNTRPGFNWENSEATIPFQYSTKNNLQASGAGGGTALNVVQNDKTINEAGTRTARHILKVEFTGQNIKDLSNEIPEATLSGAYEIGMSSYSHIGTDENGDPFNDNSQDFDVVGVISEDYSFSVADNGTGTEFTAKITEPSMRRGVFTTTNLRGPLQNLRMAQPVRPVRLNLTEPVSFVKTNMFQRELAPCQLDCGANENGPDFPLKTALLPIEERSRFSEITATKNKFALLDLTQGLQLSFDESGIRDGNGNVPEIPGNEAAVVSLVTSGGAGAMVTRRRNDDDIVLPSDLAVYYYNDNEGEDDIGWVYYRAVSKKLTPQPGTEDAARFRNMSTETTDYTVDDFNVTNTDDGLEYIGWERLSGDETNLLQNIDINADDPNVGAHLFLLDDRYDFVQIPDLSTWPEPFTPDFPLGVGEGAANNPDEPTESEARNNPSLLETFPEGEGVNALSQLSSILSVVEWKLGSLDSGTINQENDTANPSIVRTVLGAEEQPDSISGDAWGLSCPAFTDTPETRNADNKLQPLPDNNSLFVCFDNTSDGLSEPPDSPIEFKSYHASGEGLGSIITGDNPATGVDGVPTGSKMDLNSKEAEYCNAKSHFWNGHFSDINQSFTSGSDTGLKGRVPLFWRLAKDCGPNNQTASDENPGNRYFKDLDDGVINVTSDLDRPLGPNSADSDDQDRLIGYHGINIAHGQFHDDYILAQGSNDTPVLEYIVEVIRGGSVYHRDIYRLANAQTAWSLERTVADNCWPCAEYFTNQGNDITDNDNCFDFGDAGEFNPKIKSDTLYQVGIDGNEWKNGWYNPSDWRAGDIIRIYAIQPRIEGDEVVVSPGDFNNPADIRVVGTDIPPTPDIQRIKKFCPVGDWNATLTYPPCCNESCVDGKDGRSGASKVCCDSGAVCVISCSIPGLGSDGGIIPNTL